jgi:hypothetical protein
MMSLFLDLRKKFHAKLIESKVLSLRAGIASNADKASQPSIRLASRIFEQVALSAGDEIEKIAGQTAGVGFESICFEFLKEAFGQLSHVRPGDWLIGRDGVQEGSGLAIFEQYQHLAELAKAAKENRSLRAILGSDYLIKPDVLIARRPLKDEVINANALLVDEVVAKRSPLRSVNSSALLLHATISCKWTMRSDRAQNARTEALNLIKNRKGRVPHIAVVTAEPTPGRLASLAFGTGEIDCVYHFALDELVNAVAVEGLDDTTLSSMIEGNRLRDISDLPLDLAL